MSPAQASGCSEAAIKAFLYNFDKLSSGANLMVGESDISAVDTLRPRDTVRAVPSPRTARVNLLLAATVGPVLTDMYIMAVPLGDG